MENNIADFEYTLLTFIIKVLGGDIFEIRFIYL